ncbi:MAG TPA: TerB family tellurite resistance protein [Gemmatimonadales bacterium]|nr:TerB family tellurite resistance protein [Gemmatimonadales bacterium]
MLDGIRRFVRERLAPPERSAAPGNETASRSRVQLAACALLLELAHADDEFSPPERQHIENTLKRHFGLDEATAVELIRLAQAERDQALDHFQFTRLVAAEYDLSQKMVLAEVMWGVILADGHLSDHETHLVRKMASLMQLEPAYLSQARRSAAAQGERSRES